MTRIAPDGTVRSRWGGHGIANGKFDFIPAQTGGNVQGSITVGPDGKVYVSDSDNHRVQVFTAEGDFIRTFGSLDPAAGGLIVPADIGVDADGNVYVADDSAQLLHKFDATGDLLWSVTGSDDERLLGHLHGLLNNDDGNLVAINDDTGFALVLDTDGHVLDSYRTGGCSPSFDAAGNLWVGGCGWEDVRVFDLQHRLIGLSTGLGLRSPQFGTDGAVVSLDADGTWCCSTSTCPESERPALTDRPFLARIEDQRRWRDALRRIGSSAKAAAAPRMMNTRPSNDGGLSSGAVSVGGVVTVGVLVGRGVALTASSKFHVSVTPSMVTDTPSAYEVTAGTPVPIATWKPTMWAAG